MYKTLALVMLVACASISASENNRALTPLTHTSTTTSPDFTTVTLPVTRPLNDYLELQELRRREKRAKHEDSKGNLAAPLLFFGLLGAYKLYLDWAAYQQDTYQP